MSTTKTTFKPNRENSLCGKRMKKHYGECKGEFCDLCCNYQKQQRTEDSIKICIAYDEVTEWNPMEKACGLFNIPFRGLRPRHRMVCEYYKNEEAPQVEQVSLF